MGWFWCKGSLVAVVMATPTAQCTYRLHPIKKDLEHKSKGTDKGPKF